MKRALLLAFLALAGCWHPSVDYRASLAVIRAGYGSVKVEPVDALGLCPHGEGWDHGRRFKAATPSGWLESGIACGKDSGEWKLLPAPLAVGLSVGKTVGE